MLLYQGQPNLIVSNYFVVPVIFFMSEQFLIAKVNRTEAEGSEPRFNRRSVLNQRKRVQGTYIKMH